MIKKHYNRSHFSRTEVRTGHDVGFACGVGSEGHAGRTPRRLCGHGGQHDRRGEAHHYL